jgi:hypothetical protein
VVEINGHLSDRTLIFSIFTLVGHVNQIVSRWHPLYLTFLQYWRLMRYESAFILRTNCCDIEVQSETIRFFVSIYLNRDPTLIIIEVFLNPVLHSIALRAATQSLL